MQLESRKSPINITTFFNEWLYSLTLGSNHVYGIIVQYWLPPNFESFYDLERSTKTNKQKSS